jgi:hypothetical protein
MFVTPERADVAEVRWRVSRGGDSMVEAVPVFVRASVYEVAFGRSMLSRHNPSAPDMWFGDFVCAVGCAEATSRAR